MFDYWKAIVGGLTAGLGSAYQALDTGGITSQEWVAIALAVVATAGGVAGAPRRDQSTQAPDDLSGMRH